MKFGKAVGKAKYLCKRRAWIRYGRISSDSIFANIKLTILPAILEPGAA